MELGSEFNLSLSELTEKKTTYLHFYLNITMLFTSIVAEVR